MKIIKTMTTLQLLAVLLLSSVSILASAQRDIDPRQFESAIARFEEQDKTHRPPQGAIVLTGSSSIARWNDQAVSALAPLSVIPRGFGGSVMEHVLFNLDRVALTYKPRAILIYEGDNDTAFRIPRTKIVAQFEKIVAKVHDELPETRIYVLSVKPSLARVNVWDEAVRVSADLEAIAKTDPLVHYIDVATPFLKADGKVMDDIFIEDGLHLNDKGNEIWGAVIKESLMQIEGSYE